MINKSLWNNQVVICFTFDLDWASEDSIKHTVDIIEKFGFKSTFFITHSSKILSNKIKNKEIDAGIHPNFLKNSSHGKNPKDIIDYCTKLLPEAKSFRCHKYFDNNDITEILYEKGFKYDSNLCTNLECVDPFEHRSGLIRFPIYFEDGGYLLHGNSLNFKEFQPILFKKPGLYIFSFHPMHLTINSPSFSYMRKIKDSLSSSTWNKLTHMELEHLSYKGKGIRTFSLDLLNFIKKENFPVITLEEAYEHAIKII